jgi:hypothetical protein
MIFCTQVDQYSFQVMGFWAPDTKLYTFVWPLKQQIYYNQPLEVTKLRVVVNYVLHQPNAHIYLKNIKIFYKMLDKKPQHMFRLIDKPSSGDVTTACL